MKIYEQPRYVFKHLKEAIETTARVLGHDNYHTVHKPLKSEIFGASGAPLGLEIKPGSNVDTDPLTIDTVYFSFDSEPDAVYQVRESIIQNKETGRRTRTYYQATEVSSRAEVRNFPPLS